MSTELLAVASQRFWCCGWTWRISSAHHFNNKTRCFHCHLWLFGEWFISKFSDVLLFFQSNNGPCPAPAGRHESDPFSILLFSRRKRFPWRWFFFFIILFILTLCSRSEGSRSSELNQLETWSSHKPGRTLSKWAFTQPFPFDRTLFSAVKKKKRGGGSCEGKKIPLELQRFSHTLLNLPPTFVKELKGINRKEFLCGGIYLRDSGNICCKSESKLPT